MCPACLTTTVLAMTGAASAGALAALAVKVLRGSVVGRRGRS